MAVKRYAGWMKTAAAAAVAVCAAVLLGWSGATTGPAGLFGAVTGLSAAMAGSPGAATGLPGAMAGLPDAATVTADSPEAAVAPVSDVALVRRLADGTIRADGRLWVVVASGPDYMLRWAGDNAEEAVRWMKETQARLLREPEPSASHRNGPLWFVNVQGTLAEGSELGDVWERLSRTVGGVPVESYEDRGTTFSYSYLSSDASGLLSSGDISVNMQASAHLDTEIGAWRVTIGTPLILIEY